MHSYDLVSLSNSSQLYTIEKVQRRFLRMVARKISLASHSISERSMQYKLIEIKIRLCNIKILIY